MIFLQPSLSSASLRVLARGSSVHSLMLSCQHFFGLPRLLPPGTVPCMMVFASHVARVTCPYHLSFLVLTIERRSSCGSNGRPDSVPDVFVCDSVSEWDAKDLPVTFHFEGLDPSFQFSCEGPCFTCVEEGWCDYWTKYLDPVFGGDFVLPYCLEFSQRRPILSIF